MWRPRPAELAAGSDGRGGFEGPGDAAKLLLVEQVVEQVVENLVDGDMARARVRIDGAVEQAARVLVQQQLEAAARGGPLGLESRQRGYRRFVGELGHPVRGPKLQVRQAQQQVH